MSYNIYRNHGTFCGSRTVGSRNLNVQKNIHFTLLSVMRHGFHTYAQTRPIILNHRCKHTNKNARKCIDTCLSASSDSLLMTAVAKMAAMPACWGRSWISECSAAGYAGSSFTRTLWVGVSANWSTVEQDSVARRASPLDSSCVSLQNNAPPVKQTVTVRVSI